MVEHLTEGDLRRWIDEPESLTPDAQAHARACDRCSALTGELQSNAAFARRMLQGEVHLTARRSKWQDRPIYRSIAAAAAAAILICGFIFTPLGGYASAFLTIFQPKEFVPINVTSADLRQLRVSPQAGELGTMRVIRRQRMRPFSSVAAARAQMIFTPRLPQKIPSEIGRRRSFIVGSPAVYQYTFSAAKAASFEAKSRRRLPPMPPGLNGTTVTVRIGEMFGANYGVSKIGGDSDEPKAGLTVVQLQIPTVSSKGASFQQLERYMLAMPGISADLAQQIRALGDLQNQMPVPVNISKQNAQQVAVDGVRGLAIGDNTGLGAGVVWEKNGLVYGVLGGALTMDQVLAVANDLR